MSVRAYLLVQAEIGKAATVAEEIRKIPGVVLAEDVTGPYDVVVTAETESLQDLGRMVVGKVHTLGGITHAVTCMVVDLG